LAAYTPRHRREDDAEVLETNSETSLKASPETGLEADPKASLGTDFQENSETDFEADLGASPETSFRALDAQARTSRTVQKARERGERRERRERRDEGEDEGPFDAEAPVRQRASRLQLSLALGIVFIVLALVIAVFLIYKYVNADKHNDAIGEVAGLAAEVADETVAPDAGMDDLKLNWDALKAINPDIVGWIMIPDTRINYPIVQTGDNDFYLTHLSDKTPSDAGAIFLDSENDPAVAGWNNIIYGHNLLDGSMFAALKSYSDQGFFDSHRTVLLATPEKNYRLEVRAALVCDADDRIRRFGFSDRADFESYVDILLEYAVINEFAEGEVPENLYCLATCTSADYSKRTLILASVVETRAAAGDTKSSSGGA
jgi:sortase B